MCLCLGPPPTLPHPTLLAIAESRAEPPVWCSVPLAVCFTHGSVYMPTPLLPFVPPLLPCPVVSIQVCLLYLCLSSCPAKEVHQDCFSRFHMCINIRYFSNLYQGQHHSDPDVEQSLPPQVSSMPLPSAPHYSILSILLVPLSLKHGNPPLCSFFAIDNCHFPSYNCN